MCLFIRKDWQPMTARETVIYGCSCDTLSVVALSKSEFLDVLNTMITFDKTSVLVRNFPFIEAKIKDIGVDLKCSNFLPKAILATYK